jgi:hypothetical protein
MDRAVMDRLVLARHLFEQAQQGLRSGTDVGLHVFVNQAQDAVEAFVVSLADHLGASIPAKTEFDKYFVQIEKVISRELPLKTRLLRLNKIRVSSKHEGILPPRGDCESLVTSVRDFFEQVSTEYLALDFATATPMELLTDGEAKSLLIEAANDFSAGRFKECMINCRKAIYVEIEGRYDVSPFRANAPKPEGLRRLMGPFSLAPHYARNGNYIDKYVKNATDFIVLDHDRVDAELLKHGADPTSFSNVLRMTPEMWRDPQTKRWLVRMDRGVADRDDAQYVLASTLEITLALHTKRRASRSGANSLAFLGVRAELVSNDARWYPKASRDSGAGERFRAGTKTVGVMYEIEGVSDGARYAYVLGAGANGPVMGYVHESDIAAFGPEVEDFIEEVVEKPAAPKLGTPRSPSDGS